jgi:hypothetical protein
MKAGSQTGRYCYKGRWWWMSASCGRMRTGSMACCSAADNAEEDAGCTDGCFQPIGNQQSH